MGEDFILPCGSQELFSGPQTYFNFNRPPFVCGCAFIETGFHDVDRAGLEFTSILLPDS